ncbi:hypothetical protein PAMP_023342 [Pampus punctatissimus]
MADCAPLLDEELSSFVFNYLTENSGSQIIGIISYRFSLFLSVKHSLSELLSPPQDVCYFCLES